MPTVEEVWRLALPAGTKLAAGEAGLLSEVNWIVSLKPTPPGFESLKGGEMALVDAEVAERLGVQIPGLINSLARRKVTAICVCGPESENARREAQAEELPLFYLPPGTDLSGLEMNLNRLVNESRGELYQRERELGHDLMDLALVGAGVKAILARLIQVSGRPVQFLDPGFGPLDGEDGPVPDKLKLNQKLVLARLEAVVTSPPVAGIRLKDFSCFLGPVMVGRENKGYLVLAAPDLIEADRLAVRTGIMALSVEMSRRRAVEDTEDRFETEIIESLLEGDFDSPAVILERAKRIGLDLTLPHVAMVARRRGPFSHEAVLRKTRLALPGTRCHFHGESLVVLQPASSSISGDLRRQGLEAGRTLSKEFGGPVSLGLGRVYPGPEGLRSSFHEAEQALIIGTRIFGPGSVSLFAELGVYRLLFSLDKEELKTFYSEFLGTLSTYDERHGGELIRTLEARVKNDTVADTADSLHIHRNTLLYRLRRIHEISGLDMNDSETRLTLYLALRAGEILRAQ